VTRKDVGYIRKKFILGRVKNMKKVPVLLLLCLYVVVGCGSPSGPEAICATANDLADPLYLGEADKADMASKSRSMREAFDEDTPAQLREEVLRFSQDPTTETFVGFASQCEGLIQVTLPMGETVTVTNDLAENGEPRPSETQGEILTSVKINPKDLKPVKDGRLINQNIEFTALSVGVAKSIGSGIDGAKPYPGEEFQFLTYTSEGYSPEIFIEADGEFVGALPNVSEKDETVAIGVPKDAKSVLIVLPGDNGTRQSFNLRTGKRDNQSRGFYETTDPATYATPINLTGTGLIPYVQCGPRSEFQDRGKSPDDIPCAPNNNKTPLSVSSKITGISVWGGTSLNTANENFEPAKEGRMIVSVGFSSDENINRATVGSADLSRALTSDSYEFRGSDGIVYPGIFPETAGLLLEDVAFDIPDTLTGGTFVMSPGVDYTIGCRLEVCSVNYGTIRLGPEISKELVFDFDN
jgi:hypothetical protein